MLAEPTVGRCRFVLSPFFESFESNGSSREVGTGDERSRRKAQGQCCVKAVIEFVAIVNVRTTQRDNTGLNVRRQVDCRRTLRGYRLHRAGSGGGGRRGMRRRRWQMRGTAASTTSAMLSQLTQLLRRRMQCCWQRLVGE